MASEIDHVVLANKNHDCLLQLAGNPVAFPEWVTTVAFYKAVHVVEAVFANELRYHSTSHDSRQRRLKTEPKLKAIFTDFQALMTASRIARYLEASSGKMTTRFKTFTDAIPVPDVMDQLVYKRLYRVEQFLLPFLSSGASSLLKKTQPPPKLPANQSPTIVSVGPASPAVPPKHTKRVASSERD